MTNGGRHPEDEPVDVDVEGVGDFAVTHPFDLSQPECELLVLGKLLDASFNEELLLLDDHCMMR